jgi:hypothetical protein
MTSSYKVGFDGKWQENFESQHDALVWAEEVARTGRLVWVIERRRLRTRLVTAFPTERREEARRAWEDLRSVVGT